MIILNIVDREYVARLVGAKGKNLQGLIEKAGVQRMRVDDDSASSSTATVQVVRIVS